MKKQFLYLVGFMLFATNSYAQWSCETPENAGKFIDSFSTNDRVITVDSDGISRQGFATDETMPAQEAYKQLKVKFEKFIRKNGDQYEGKKGAFTMSTPRRDYKSYGKDPGETFMIGLAAMVNPYAGLAAYGQKDRAAIIYTGHIYFFEGLTQDQLKQMVCQKEQECANKYAQHLKQENLTEAELQQKFEPYMRGLEFKCK